MIGQIACQSSPLRINNMDKQHFTLDYVSESEIIYILSHL